MNLALFAAALLCAPLVYAAPVESLPPLVAVIWVWRARGLAQRALWIAGGLLVLGLVRTHHAAALGKRDQYELQLGAPSECEGDVEITGRSRGHAQGDRFSSMATTSVLSCVDRSGRKVAHAFRQPLSLMLSSPLPMRRGDRAHVFATVALVYPWNNPGALDRSLADASRGYCVTANAHDVQDIERSRSLQATIDQVRDRVRAHIVRVYPHDVEALVRALVIGEADLQPEVTTALRGAGLLHLLAVSGMHLVVVLGALRKVLSALLVRIEHVAARVDVDRVAYGAVGAVAFLYADFAGGSGSAWRAAWMSAVVCLVRAFERKPCAKRALSMSIIVMAIGNPLAVFDVSLLLSALATGGLLQVEQEGKLSYLIGSLRATAAATVPCVPVLAKMSGTLSAGAFVANVVAVPLGELVTLPACLIEPALAPLPRLQSKAIVLGTGGLRAVMAIAEKVNGIDFMKVGVPPPSAAQNGAFVAGAAVALGLRRRHYLVGLTTLTAVAGLECMYRRDAAAQGVLSMIALDVGQGDATLVHFPDGQWGLVDAGGIVGPGMDVGARVIAPVLRELRISALAVVVLSHPHPDHYGGFRSGLDGIHVAEFWDTGQGAREQLGGDYASLLSSLRAANVPIRRPTSLCGIQSVHGATVHVMMPCPDSDETRTPNDNSLIIKVSYRSRSFLLVGDAEREEEALLLRAHGQALRADVLKVGHHGSRTSTTVPFVSAVSPRVATISAGVRNQFGHPHPLTLDALSQVSVRRTDREGAITISTNGESLQVTVRP